MPWLKQKRLRVVYGAVAAREFPESVREWLGETNHRAVASPNVYDALALLSTGRSPAAIIVSMDSVDWEEMPFFEHVTRLASTTRVYVSGEPHCGAKIESACRLGAHVFDADALDRDLNATFDRSGETSMERLVAGTLPVPEGASASPLTPAEADPPSVRLVASPETDDTDASPVPVPWLPNPLRPQRTRPPEQTSPVVTPEELAALFSQPDPPETGTASEP